MLPPLKPSTYYFFGTPFVLVKDYYDGSSPRYSYSYPFLNIFLPYSINRHNEKAAFHKQASSALQKLLAPFLKRTIKNIEYPLSYNRAVIVDKEWTWGTCSYKGTISFALRLFLAPVPIINYVVIHELSHLRYKNHSKYFWKEVERYDPNYRTHDAWLNKNGKYLMNLKNL